MPYILSERRKELDPIVELLVSEGFLPDGNLATLLFVFCRDCVKPSYNNYKNFCGELDQCIIEIMRRQKSFRGPVRRIAPGEEVNYEKILSAMQEARVKADGDLNYILFKYCKYHICNIEGFCQEIDRCLVAVQEDLMAPYEDKKKEENGDVRLDLF